MPKSPERIQFLTDVFTTALEGGIGYWSECSYYRWENEQRAVIEDIEDERKEYTITLDTIAKGIGVIVKGDHVYQDLKNLIRNGSLDNDASDIDAEGADCIVQAGLFGRVIYG